MMTVIAEHLPNLFKQARSKLVFFWVLYKSISCSLALSSLLKVRSLHVPRHLW
jgi:hypothetical protein